MASVGRAPPGHRQEGAGDLSRHRSARTEFRRYRQADFRNCCGNGPSTRRPRREDRPAGQSIAQRGRTGSGQAEVHLRTDTSAAADEAPDSGLEPSSATIWSGCRRPIRSRTASEQVVWLIDDMQPRRQFRAGLIEAEQQPLPVDSWSHTSLGCYYGRPRWPYHRGQSASASRTGSAGRRRRWRLGDRRLARSRRGCPRIRREAGGQGTGALRFKTASGEDFDGWVVLADRNAHPDGSLIRAPGGGAEPAARTGARPRRWTKAEQRFDELSSNGRRSASPWSTARASSRNATRRRARWPASRASCAAGQRLVDPGGRRIPALGDRSHGTAGRTALAATVVPIEVSLRRCGGRRLRPLS